MTGTEPEAAAGGAVTTSPIAESGAAESTTATAASSGRRTVDPSERLVAFRGIERVPERQVSCRLDHPAVRAACAPTPATGEFAHSRPLILRP